MPTMTEHPDHALVVEALDTLSNLLDQASPVPWTVFEEHGRDFTGEGQSTIALTAADDPQNLVAVTHAPGYEDAADHAEANAVLVAHAVSGFAPALTLLRYVADRHRPIIPTGPAPLYAARCLSCSTIAPCEEYAGVAAVVNVALTLDPKTVDERPHSRACGIHEHPHGSRCHTNCPTCGGRDA